MFSCFIKYVVFCIFKYQASRMKFFYSLLLSVLFFSCYSHAVTDGAPGSDSLRYEIISETSLAYADNNHLFDRIKKTTEGNYVFLLRTEPSIDKQNLYGDRFLLTLSPDGDTLERKQVYDNFISPEYIELEDHYYVLAQDFDTMAPEGWIYLSKYDKNWKLLWRKTIGKPVAPDSNAELVLTSKKELLVIADEEQIPGDHKTRPGLSVSRYLGDGNLISRKFYRQKDLLTSVSIIPSLDNHYFVSSFLYGPAGRAFRILKINDAGDTLWTKDHKNFDPKHALQLKDSSLLFYGSDYTCMEKVTDSCQFTVVLKTDKNGNLLWRKELKGNHNEIQGNMVALQNSHYLFSTAIEPVKDKGWFVYIYELDKDGNRVFHKKFNFPAGSQNAPVLLQGNNQVTLVSEKWIGKFGEPFRDAILITRMKEK
jgi:hypothetical protein